MAWQPDQVQLKELVGYLRDSLNGRDPAAQKRATLMLSQAKGSPDITNYLTYILCSLPPSIGLPQDETQLARNAAAITLKNIVRSRYSTLSPDKQLYIRSSVLKSIQDPHLQIRNFVGNVITEIVKQGGVLGWPEVFPELFVLAKNEKGDVPASAQEGAMSALAKICEDNRKALDRKYQGQRPNDVIIPQLYGLTSSANAKVRAIALEILNMFIPQKPPTLIETLPTFMERLSNLANDPNDDVRRYVCRAFTQLVDVRPELIGPQMEKLVPYVVQQQRNIDDPTLALDAAEFWLSVGENRELCGSLGPFLATVVPTLLESMVYSEEDQMRLEAEGDDADEDDREQDVAPVFAKDKNRVAVNGNEGNTDTPEEGELSDGEIADDEDEELDPEDEWNLRKCSAAALDVLATVFHGPVFEVSLPYLKNNLVHKDWPNREAAVLALGAVADGCMDVVSPHLPELVPFLLNMLQDPQPIIRKITCWALGRYTKWAMQEEFRAKFFEPIMEGTLKQMLDRNKSVQEGAASAFSNIEEIARYRLTPYCKPILEQFVKCFDIYKDRNMFILYDCVQTLAEHIGPSLANPELLNVLMPALVKRWEKLTDSSRELFPLLECLSYVATALGDAFGQFAPPIFGRCVRIVHQNLEQFFAANNNEALDKPDKDFLISSLDLLSAIIGALPAATSGELVNQSQPKLFDLLRYCLEDPNLDVRQSSYALLGDCASHIFSQLQPSLRTIIPILIEQIDLNSMPPEEADAAFAVVNNACWSCGEIAKEEKQGLGPFIPKLYERLFAIITNPEIPQSVNENAAIALGRLGIWYAEPLAVHLPDFAKTFLETVDPVEETDEKDQALLGFNTIVPKNPEALGDCLVLYLKTAAGAGKRSTPPQGLLESFSQIINGYKQMIPTFSSFVSQLQPQDQQIMANKFGIS